jgi:predicted acetyltransferase
VSSVEFAAVAALFERPGGFVVLALIAPTVELYPQWLDAHREWGPGAQEDGFGLDPTDDVDSPSGFSSWVELLHRQSDAARERRATCRWIVDENRVLGGIALRHGMNDVIRELGHIGYGVRPSARRQGVATWALGEMLVYARSSGLDRVLVVCEADNTASVKTAERHGGVLEGPRETDQQPVCRFWITLGTPDGTFTG